MKKDDASNRFATYVFKAEQSQLTLLFRPLGISALELRKLTDFSPPQYTWNSISLSGEFYRRYMYDYYYSDTKAYFGGASLYLRYRV